MIDIIIPAYNAEKTIKKTLLSIASQNNIDIINTYIIDDYSDYTYDDTYTLFKDKMNIKLYRLNNNKGPGYARQFGIEHSNSDYIMFVDSDDILYDPYAIENLLTVMKQGYDIVLGNVIVYSDEEITKYMTELDTIHAKLYRRKFLIDNKINFPSFYNSEDIAFNYSIILNNPNIGYSHSDIYSYIRRINSLTNNEEYYYKKHIKNYIIAIKWVMKYAKENKKNNYEIAYLLTFSMAYLYYYFCDNMQDKNLKYVYEIAPLYKKYSKYIDRDEEYNIVTHWISRLQKYQIDLSFREFISQLDINNKEKK